MNKKEADKAFKMSIKIDRRNFQTYLNRGIFYAKIGEVQKALDSFRNAYMLNPNEAQSVFL